MTILRRIAGSSLWLAVAAALASGCAGAMAADEATCPRCPPTPPVVAPAAPPSAPAAEGNAPAQPRLDSWVEGPSRQAIEAFVAKVTNAAGPDFVPPAQRIAVFDNDGTLWSEQPAYVQLAFTLDRIKQLAPQHPEWKTKQPFKAVLAGDMKAVAAGGEKALVALIGAASGGTTSDEYTKIVEQWISTARHPKYGRPYTELVYTPMVELLAYLRAHQFKTYIVSGGGVEFMRPWAEATYGIPPEQVIGSRMKTKWEDEGAAPVIQRLPELGYLDDGPGKPLAIYDIIGRRPIFAAGNSDGDFAMLRWTTSGTGARLGIIVHHTDVERETAYDRDSHIGKLDKGLDAAPQNGWVVVDMKSEWKTVFAARPQ